MTTNASTPHTGPPPFRLRTLGSPALVRDDGSPADLPLGKPFALLVHVALESSAVMRDDLAALLWPRVPRERGRQSVRQALLLLRKALGPDVFAGDDPVRLEPGRVLVDIDEFRDALLRRDMVRAAALWEGPFLDRFELAVGHGFQSWVEAYRSTLEHQYASALEETADVLSSAGNTKAGLAHLRRAVGVVPWDARLRTRLVESLIAARELPSAETELVEARRELGPGNPRFDPDALERKLAALRASTELQRTAPALELELVGRVQELADLLGLWRRARSGRGAAAFIAGPTGIGKSRLAEEASTVARTDGGAVVLVKASEPERQIEYGVIAALIRRLLRLRGAAGITSASDVLLRSLVPSLSSTPADSRPGAEAGGIQPAALSDALADLLSAVAEESPLAIVLDDLHWADAESVSILATLLRRGGSTACLFLLTCRREEAGPELRALARALEYERVARCVYLEPLSRSDVSELVGLMATFADASGIDHIAGPLHDVTGGNPLFIVEILRTLHEESALEHEDGEWRFRTDRLPAEFPLPASLRLVVERRFERLSADAALVAGHLARASHGESVAALRKRTGLSDGAFTRAASELIDREVLRWTDPDGLDFTHDQLHEAARRKFPVIDSLAAQRPQPPRLRRRIVMIAALALVVVSAVALRYALLESAPPLYGGGMLYFLVDDSFHVARPPDRAGGSWSLAAPPYPVPPDVDVSLAIGPVVMPDGSRLWFDYASAAETPPWVERVLESGERSTVARDSGDVTFAGQSPDGRFILLTRDDPATAGYDLQVMIANGDGSSWRSLRPGSGVMSIGNWSPDGSLLAATTNYRDLDSLLLLTPVGDVAHAVPLESTGPPAGPTWCSNRRIVFDLPQSDENVLAIWEAESDRVRKSLAPSPERFTFLCSPDGSVVAYPALVDGVLQTVVTDIETDEWHILPLPEGAIPKRWIPDRPPVIERKVRILAPDSIALGDRTRLSATITMTDRSTRDGPVHWASTDPFTISIDSAGIATANRPGRARIIGTSASWLADTVELRVFFDSTTTGWRFHDDLAEFDSSTWLIFGNMDPPTPVDPPTGPALLIHSDGLYQDGLFLRREFTLPHGGTLEAEFQLPLTRWDRQRFLLCLADMDLPPVLDGRADWRRTASSSACFAYPVVGSYPNTFEPDAAMALVNGIGRPIRSPDDFPADGWTHVAIDVQPDGHVRFQVNRHFVMESPARIPDATHKVWRVVVEGASVDTYLLIRDLTLWDGQRY